MLVECCFVHSCTSRNVPIAVKIAITDMQRPEQEVVALEDWVRRARL
jgi:hypothetical protein